LSGTEIMYNLRKNFFSTSALAGNQYRDIRGGHLFGHIDRPVEQGRISDDPKSIFYILYIHFSIVYAGTLINNPTDQGSRCASFTQYPYIITHFVTGIYRKYDHGILVISARIILIRTFGESFDQHYMRFAHLIQKP